MFARARLCSCVDPLLSGSCLMISDTCPLDDVLSVLFKFSLVGLHEFVPDVPVVALVQFSVHRLPETRRKLEFASLRILTDDDLFCHLLGPKRKRSRNAVFRSLATDGAASRRRRTLSKVEQLLSLESRIGYPGRGHETGMPIIVFEVVIISTIMSLRRPGNGAVGTAGSALGVFARGLRLPATDGAAGVALILVEPRVRRAGVSDILRTAVSKQGTVIENKQSWSR
ncbi:hypothetical protein KCU93_g108, partial [Aureobasidium melanogenum]